MNNDHIDLQLYGLVLLLNLLLNRLLSIHRRTGRRLILRKGHVKGVHGLTIWNLSSCNCAYGKIQKYRLTRNGIGRDDSPASELQPIQHEQRGHWRFVHLSDGGKLGLNQEKC